MQILNGKLVRSETTKNARGGSELMAERIVKLVPENILKPFQIILSRPAPLERDKLRIYWAHDLADDPAAEQVLGNDGWKNYSKIVFVSHWQRNEFLHKFNIPYSKTLVLFNGIYPIEPAQEELDDKRPVKFIYHTTPHRGLNILVGVFNELAKGKWKNKIHLDVYSSFKVYGWEDQDKHYEKLFNFIKNHDHMTYHGAVSNEQIRTELAESDIFAYPCIHRETSCLALIEAMSAGVLCVHSDLAALAETSANMTLQYNFHEVPEQHANIMARVLDNALENLSAFNAKKQMAKLYADNVYNIENIAKGFTDFLEVLSKTAPTPPPEEPMFVYRR